MRRLLWHGNSSGSDRDPNSSDNPVCLSVQSYGLYCQHYASTTHIFLKFLAKFRHILPPIYGTLSQLLTIGTTIHGQQLVYIIISKWINEGVCLDRTQTFHRRYLKLNHLYKL
jgi:hypothetical protein